MSDQAFNTAFPFQARVVSWMNACFGPEISGDKLERGDRLLEEVFELLQSGDYPRERIRALEGYVYGRDKGEPAQEVGGVMVTLAAYCHAHAIDMHEAGEVELALVWMKVDAIRAKQAAKPTGSALPVPVAAVEIYTPTEKWTAYESAGFKGEWGVNSDDPTLAEAGDEIIVYPSLCEQRARLIAAAPDLLEALQDALRDLIWLHQEFGGSGETLKCIGRSSTALARAEGR